MRPQTITYKDGNGDQVTRLESSNTFLVNSSELQWGKLLFPPTIFVEGIKNEKLKFDFYKAYKNSKDEVKHCEYRSVHGEEFKLIVHTQ